jgi:hypothetical protein
MTGPIPYYWVNPKNARAYWKPNKRAMGLGFGCVSLGKASLEAEERARTLNRQLRNAKHEDPEALGVRAIRRNSDAHHVYFLQLGNLVKIGVSRNPLKRIQTLASAGPGRLKRAVIVVGSRADEKRLHDRFRAYRTSGEWFIASRPVLLTIGRCAAAGIVVHDGVVSVNEGGLGVESDPGFGVKTEISVNRLTA